MSAHSRSHRARRKALEAVDRLRWPQRIGPLELVRVSREGDRGSLYRGEWGGYVWQWGVVALLLTEAEDLAAPVCAGPLGRALCGGSTRWQGREVCPLPGRWVLVEDRCT